MSESVAITTESRAVLHHHARSFHLASVFLPADCRDDAAVLYAICRLIDDTADEAPSHEVAVSGLADLRAQIEGHTPASPLVVAALDILERGDIGPEPLLHMLDGVESDLGPRRVLDDRELLRYCYQVAGTVGLMMCGALGVTDPRARAFAIDLGVGMQLTNICRDVLEDTERDRVYLPETRLRAAGVAPDALVAGSAPRTAVANVVRDLLDLADRYYDSADLGMHWIPARSRVAIVVASRVYREIGTVLRNRDCDALAGRAWAGPGRKAVAVSRALLAALRLSFVTASDHDATLHTALTGLPGAQAKAA